MTDPVQAPETGKTGKRTMTDFQDIFFKRMSKRCFLDKPVEEEKLQKLFEIVRWSPSPSNNQPWRFVVVTDPVQHDRFMACLPRGNQWADCAPVLIAVCGRPQDDGIRDDDPVQYYQFSGGLATMSLILGAVSMDLLAHPMAGYDAFKLKETLEIPSEYHILAIVALGYQGTIDMLDERTKEKDMAPRVRKPINEIIARDKWTFTES